jgi:hypothetical protein
MTWVVTPQEPDQDMLTAGIAKWNACGDVPLVSKVWQMYEAMLDARPRITEPLPECPR